MSRTLDKATLDVAAKHYAGLFMSDSGAMNSAWVIAQFHQFAFKDAYDHLVVGVKANLGPAAVERWDAAVKKDHEPRTDKVLEELLAKNLAIDLNGDHIEGQIGTNSLGGRRVGTHIIEVEAPWSIMRRNRLGLPKTAEHREVLQKVVPLDWPIYAGEEEERARSQGGVADPIPNKVANALGTFLKDESGALATRISIEAAILGCDALVNAVDEGSVGGTIDGRTTPRPANVNDAVTGSALFIMTMAATAFNGASDDTPGAIKTANAVVDEASAIATGTLLYVRCSSSNSADTPLNDHIEGEAGTSGADWNFNTLAIVAAATVSTTSWTVTLPEG